MEKRRMCPNCRAFVTVDDRVCPYCDIQLGPRAADRLGGGPAILGLIPSGQFTTSMILLVNVMLFAATVVVSLGSRQSPAPMNIDLFTLQSFGAMYGPAMVRESQWWRLVTAGFLHGGVLHILMNSWSLYDLGATVEELFGTRRYVVVYFVSTVTGFLASFWWSWNPALPSIWARTSVGASAGIFGLIGAMIALGTRRHATARVDSSVYTRWAMYGLVLGFMPGLQVDNAAHVGGLAGGFVTAYLAGLPRLTETFGERIWRGLAWVCLLLTVLCFALMGQSLLALREG